MHNAPYVRKARFQNGKLPRIQEKWCDSNQIALEAHPRMRKRRFGMKHGRHYTYESVILAESRRIYAPIYENPGFSYWNPGF